MTGSVRAMRCFTRRSGLLRTTPLFGVVAVPEPAAIACVAVAVFNVAYFGAQLARAL